MNSGRQRRAASASDADRDATPGGGPAARVRDQRTLTLAGRWETNGAVMADIA